MAWNLFAGKKLFDPPEGRILGFQDMPVPTGIDLSELSAQKSDQGRIIHP
jgi:hypothetical protein